MCGCDFFSSSETFILSKIFFYLTLSSISSQRIFDPSSPPAPTSVPTFQLLFSDSAALCIRILLGSGQKGVKLMFEKGKNVQNELIDWLLIYSNLLINFCLIFTPFLRAKMIRIKKNSHLTSCRFKKSITFTAFYC